VAEAALKGLDHELSRPRTIGNVDTLDALGKHESDQI
jgi:hypothetical protein